MKVPAVLNKITICCQDHNKYILLNCINYQTHTQLNFFYIIVFIIVNAVVYLYNITITQP